MDQSLPTAGTETSQLVPSPKSHVVSKLLILLGIILFGIVSGAAGYFLGQQRQIQKASTASPTPTPQQIMQIQEPSPAQAGWKTYDNQTIGISFQYPSTWTVSDNLKSVSLVDPSYTDPACKGDCSQFSVEIWGESNPTNLSIPDFLKMQAHGHSAPALLNETDTNPLGISFQKSTTAPSAIAVYYTQHESYVFSLGAYAGTNGMTDADSPKLDERLNQFNKVFETFHFIK